MSNHIVNFTALATTSLRRDALSIAEAAYDAIDTREVIAKNCHLDDAVLSIAGQTYNLDAYEHVYLIGFGKASCTAISKLEGILEHQVTDGVVIDKSPGVCQTVKVYQGAHPLPSPQNVEFSSKVTDIAINATENDLVIVVASGGGSSLLCWPLSECEQGNKLYQAFLSTGGSITELNTLRKHISSVKGGGLAKLLYPATVVALVFSDVPGDRYDEVASGPTYKDSSTIADAEAILAKYNITETFEFIETPKEDIYFEKVTNIPLVSNTHAVEGMKEKAEALGYKTIVVSTEEYREASVVLEDMKNHLAPKTAVLLAGEPSVVVTKPGDKGGRNEYAAAKALVMIKPNQVCIPFASDGIDNKSDAAGAIIDSLVLEKANREGIDISTYIEEGSYDDLCKDLGVQIITGPTGSNVSDCILLLQGEEETASEVVVSDVFAECIADSRNVPTLRVTVTGSDGSKGMFSVPSGASTGIHEAHELRDDGTSHGGVTKACELINTEIVNAIRGVSLFSQEEVDSLMIKLDGTETKLRLGGNSLIGVSVALAKAAASSKKVPVWKYLHDVYFSDRQLEFPRLYANLINGGKHASTALAFQEYHVVPKTKIPSEALQIIQTIQDALKSHAEHRFGVLSVGDEGGYALPYTDVIAPLTLLKEVVEELGLQEQVDFALDVASSSFYDVDAQVYRIDNVPYSSETLTKLYETIAGRFPMVSVEDPFNEDAFDDFAQLKRSVTFLRVGDDLTTTSKSRLEKAITLDSVDALIIKPNQIGTLTETIETMRFAFKNNIKTIVSHRSGETMDDFIADLAYASGSFGIKAGARGPKEREAKYTRLLAINEEVK